MDVRTRAARHYHRGIYLLLCAKNARPREVALPALSCLCVDEAHVTNAVVQKLEEFTPRRERFSQVSEHVCSLLQTFLSTHVKTICTASENMLTTDRSGVRTASKWGIALR